MKVKCYAVFTLQISDRTSWNTDGQRIEVITGIKMK